jgi:hypothetical protein
MTKQEKDAIDLLIEDLYTTHTNIRQDSKVLGCEQELLKIRDDVVKYLKSYK